MVGLRSRIRLASIARLAIVGLVATGLASCGAGAPAPTRSPEGWVAFVSSTLGGSEGIYVMNPDGSGRRRISTSSGPGLSWSPDGSRIVFTSNPGISVMNADGSAVTKLTNAGEGPAWSPDGRLVAFSIRPNETLSNDPPDEATIALIKQVHLRVMNIDGSGLTGLTSGPVSDESPSWSADGARLAFDRNYVGEMQQGDCSGICLVDADGSGLAQLPADGFRPAWSPDGERIAYVANASGAAGIWISSVDGSNPRNVTPDLASGSWADFSDPAWSPDGRRLAFSLRLRNSPTDIYVVDLDGAHLTRIAEGVGETWGISWR